ncbi:MAG TPA: Asp-tRNA(Asn)/Glu-tRNA(Gln) amidotransferase subunit GatA [Candidatus Paceibacterota bacterium]
MKIDLENLTIAKARKHLDNGDFSALDLAKAYLDEIKKKNKDIHAYLEVFSDVEEQAKEADKKIKEFKNLKTSKPPDLLGIPIAIKDNILIKGRKVSAASKMLENYIAPYDATAILKLKSAGAVFLGRVNMDEFAMGASTENSAFGPTKNPHDLSRVPGGTSGGSAAAVAANMALVALGSDTGGSVRQPSSFCGVIGYKPSYGGVSRYGLMAMGSSLDVIGTVSRTIADAEILFSVIKGKDPQDSTSIDVSLSSSGKKKLKIADMTPFIGDVGAGGVDPKVMENYKESLLRLKKLGHEIVTVKTDLSALKYALPTYYIIMPAEVSTNLARLDGVRYGLYKDNGGNLISDYKETRGAGFGRETRRRILLGTYVLSAGYYDAYYGKASAVRGLIRKTFGEIFKEVDLVATPTAPTPAFKLGEKMADPVQMYLADIFTVTANMASIPAVSLPSGFTEVEGKKLPLGFQLLAPYGEDGLLFDAGKDFLGESK